VRAYLTSCLQEVKTELKENDPETIQKALQKLFYVTKTKLWDFNILYLFLKKKFFMEGYDIRFAGIYVLRNLGSETFPLKRLSQSLAHLTLDSSSELLILSTSSFKKVLKTLLIFLV
jgi:hypothetical protein